MRTQGPTTEAVLPHHTLVLHFAFTTCTSICCFVIHPWTCMKTRSNEIKITYFNTFFTQYTLSCRGVAFFQFFYLEMTSPHMAEETVAYMEKDPSVQNHPLQRLLLGDPPFFWVPKSLWTSFKIHMSLGKVLMGAKVLLSHPIQLHTDRETWDICGKIPSTAKGGGGSETE